MTEEEDLIDCRRISDVLPTDMAKQIGLDPCTSLFGMESQSRRRMTDPGGGFARKSDDVLGSRRSVQYSPLAMTAGPMMPVNPPTISGWFRVELKDRTVCAYATFPVNASTADGVVVRDGAYLRYGRIMGDTHRPAEYNWQSPQITGIDKNSALSDYLQGQAMVASALIPSFLMKSECSAEFQGIECVSYQGRALLRVKMSNADAPNMDKVVRLLIHMFSVAVEVYDSP
jgi:hypothetical protein